MLSAFDETFTTTNIDSILSSKKPSLETVTLLKDQVVNFLKENYNLNKRRNQDVKGENNIKRINRYFDNLKSILSIERKSNQYDLLYITNISQFKKINDLIHEFSQFEESMKRLYRPLKEFLDTANNFLVDSAKEIYFDKVSSELRFNILNKNGTKIDENRDVKNLSSGEKQILILLTYLKYNNTQNLLIIDEPELSLHPKWQAEFLDAVEKLMPKNSQLLLATHSPEIIGNRKDNCTVLLPYNN
jgi:predicted ATPase